MSNSLVPLGIPVAWRQLSADPKRLATAIAGVAFGVMLMLFQLGLFNAINAMVVYPHANLRGDLFMVSPDFEYFGSNREFTRRRLYQALALPEVESVAPIYLGFLYWTNPETRKSKTIFAMAINPAENPFLNRALTEQIEVLRNPEAVLFDTLSQSDYGPIEELSRRPGVFQIELERKRAVVKGFFTMGPTLAASGNIVMSDEAWFRYRVDKARNMTNVGLIRLKPGTAPEPVASKLSAMLSGDVRVLTRADFVRAEQEYWNKRTPIGFIVGAGMLVGMLVGAIVVYQILYTDVNDHLKEYATLKAIGLGDGFFTILVLEQALILLALGAIPAGALTMLLNHFARTQVNLPAYIEWLQAAKVMGAVAVMCLLAGRLATRRLRSADPANVF